MLSRLASRATFDGHYATAVDYGEHALATARSLAAPGTIAVALNPLGTAHGALGCPRGLEMIAESLHISRRIGFGYGIATGLTNLTGMLTIHDRPAEAVELALPGLDELWRLGLHRSGALALAGFLADALLDSGRWDEADQISQAFTVDMEPSVTAGLGQLARALLLLRRGRHADASALLEAVAGWAVGQAHPGLSLVVARTRAESLLWQGDWKAARVQLDRAQPPIRNIGFVWNALRIFALSARLEADALDAARLAAHPTDMKTARAAAARQVGLARDVLAEAEQASGCSCPAFHRLLDQVRAEAARLDDPTDPEPLARLAADASHNPYRQAYARWREAQAVLSGRGARSRAATALRQAHRTADRLRAVPLRDEIAELAHRARIDLAESSPPAATEAVAPGRKLGLTDRETEVLRLLGRGLSNAEIGKTLYIRPKTVRSSPAGAAVIGSAVIGSAVIGRTSPSSAGCRGRSPRRRWPRRPRRRPRHAGTWGCGPARRRRASTSSRRAAARRRTGPASAARSARCPLGCRSAAGRPGRAGPAGTRRPGHAAERAVRRRAPLGRSRGPSQPARAAPAAGGRDVAGRAGGGH